MELTEQEEQIIKLASQGACNNEIAGALYVSPDTVKAHMREILRKLNADNRTHATYIALKYNIIE